MLDNIKNINDTKVVAPEGNSLIEKNTKSDIEKAIIGGFCD